MPETFTALGLMSGTSMDGIDAAVLETDGETYLDAGPALSRPYPKLVRARIRDAVEAAQDLAPGAAWPAVFKVAEREITMAHALVVRELLSNPSVKPDGIQILGFHGQTILHQPARVVGEEQARTIQLGNAELLAQLTGIAVINDFRRADVEAGGEGAPLTPLYHAALAHSLPEAEPCAVVNIGGVANVSFIDRVKDVLLAFDTGPGNAPIDEWVEENTGALFDKDGALARSGRVHDHIVSGMLANEFFDRPPPKSLDRCDFTSAPVRGLSLDDGCATLTAFTAASIAAAKIHFPYPVGRWVICGGGRHNPTLMDQIKSRLDVPVLFAEDVKWRGDFLEAEAFAYLAVRSLHRLPLSLPSTTGVPEPVQGGTYHPVPH